jgi:hypothetical protein
MSNEQPSADDERAAPYPSPEAQMQVAAYKEQVRAEIRADELEVERDAARLALAERDAEIARLGLEKQAGDEIIFGLRQQVDELKAEIARLKPAPGYLSGKLNPFPERPPGADDEPDARYEEGLRKEIGDPRPDNPAWRPNQYHASDMAFLLRRLDAARLAQAQADLDAGAPTRRAMRGSSAPFSNSLRRSGTS